MFSLNGVAAKELGCVVFEVAAHYDTLYLGSEPAPVFFFKKVSELNVLVCVHHTVLPVQYDSILNNDTFRRQFGTAACQDQAHRRWAGKYSATFLNNFPTGAGEQHAGRRVRAHAELLVPEPSKVKEELERFDVAGSAKARKHPYTNIYFGITVTSAWRAPAVECAVKVLAPTGSCSGALIRFGRNGLRMGLSS